MRHVFQAIQTHELQAGDQPPGEQASLPAGCPRLKRLCRQYPATGYSRRQSLRRGSAGLRRGQTPGEQASPLSAVPRQATPPAYATQIAGYPAWLASASMLGAARRSGWRFYIRRAGWRQVKRGCFRDHRIGLVPLPTIGNASRREPPAPIHAAPDASRQPAQFRHQPTGVDSPERARVASR
jgi:hypothetical protein